MTERTKKTADYIFFKQTIFKSNFLIVQITSVMLIIYLIVMGSYLVHSGSYLFEYKERIDHNCLTDECNIRMRIDKDIIAKPLFIYIAYEGFFLNHRKVIYSVDYDQLAGKPRTAEELKTNCEDYLTVSDLKAYHPDIDIKGNTGNTPVNPCGLFAFLYTQCKLIR